MIFYLQISSHKQDVYFFTARQGSYGLTKKIIIDFNMNYKGQNLKRFIFVIINRSKGN
jgi:hypothetical protein